MLSPVHLITGTLVLGLISSMINNARMEASIREYTDKTNSCMSAGEDAERAGTACCTTRARNNTA